MVSLLHDISFADKNLFIQRRALLRFLPRTIYKWIFLPFFFRLHRATLERREEVTQQRYGEIFRLHPPTLPGGHLTWERRKLFWADESRAHFKYEKSTWNFTTMRFLMLLTLSRRTSKFWFNSIMQNILVCRRFKCPSSLKMALQTIAWRFWIWNPSPTLESVVLARQQWTDYGGVRGKKFNCHNHVNCGVKRAA